jgi:hypothetical protein
MSPKLVRKIDPQGIATDRNQGLDVSKDQLLVDMAQFLYEIYRKNKQKEASSE